MKLGCAHIFLAICILILIMIILNQSNPEITIAIRCLASLGGTITLVTISFLAEAMLETEN